MSLDVYSTERLDPGERVALDELRQATSVCPTGVSVLTTAEDHGDGPIHGTCVGTFTRVSLDPPLVSVCVAADGRAAQALAVGCRFGVSTLSADQAFLARWFSGAGRVDAEMPDCGCLICEHESVTFESAVAGFHCAVTQTVGAGDHVLVLAEVLAAWRHPTRDALVHHRGNLVGCNGAKPHRPRYRRDRTEVA